MIINGYKIDTFTHLQEQICIKVLKILESEFWEIGDFLIEDNEVIFRVNRGFFENAPILISSDTLKLVRIEKSEYHYALGYKIIT